MKYAEFSAKETEGTAVKIVILKSKGIFSPILRKIFGIKKRK